MDRYQRIKKIGEGSFGKALLVRSKETGRQFVVKEINMSKMAKKERDEARKETAVLAQLQHPNIVTYRESFEELGNLYIVMDYCEGGDLYGKINAQRGVLFVEDQVTDWFVQICLAIKHIHDRKILHRDIKSQNIFITKHGIIKLGDFGIAKVLNSTVELARTCIGTPYYLSPEICENKPYNNKSDIWSLGCVLYELTTLKHAFEAGNMKNLVLKIIRGSYPPVPSRYSYELRSLIAQLFKRTARDRPSISAVLRKPILQNRIRKFLTESELAEEFSHTVLHGRNLKKALPPGQNRPQPVRAQAPKPVAAKKPPSTPRYDPALVYGPSVARKSRDKENKARKSSDPVARRSSDGKRAPSGGNAQSELQRRRQELLEKERARRDAAKAKDIQYARAHKDLVEKQKAHRINKAREEGWKNLLSSDDSDTPRKNPVPQRNDEPKRMPVTPVPKPSGQPAMKAPADSYERYHEWLNNRDRERKAADMQGRAPPMAGFNPISAAQQGDAAGARGAAAAEKAKALEDYLARKREAALYKARGQGDLLGARGALGAPRPKPSPAAGGRPPSGAQAPTSAREAHRKQQEQEYLQRLKQIRLQNFNERRNIKENLQQKGDAKYKPNHDDAEVRRKKIEALRAQAEERANRLKGELEKKRQEVKPVLRPKVPAHRAVRADPPKPAAVFPMTEAMKAIGAAKPQPAPMPDKPGIGMTAAMEAIGAKSPLQQQKDSILKRLNSAKPSVAQEVNKPVRPKWGEPACQIAQERPRWEGAGTPEFAKMSLEETASHMEVTSSQDVVERHPVTNDNPSESDAVTPGRRQWATPAGTVLRALAERELSSGTESSVDIPSPNELEAGGGSPAESAEKAEKPASNFKAPAIGTTVTIVRSDKGTVIIKKACGDAPDGGSDSVTSSVEDSSKQEDVPSSADETSEDVRDSKSPLVDQVELEDLEEEGEEEEGSNGVSEGNKEGKVEEKEEDETEDKVQNVGRRVNMMVGLTSGQFDMRNTRMLRTCSEPDLSKLFRTLAQAGLHQDERSSSMDDLGQASDTEDGVEEGNNEEMEEAPLDQEEELQNPELSVVKEVSEDETSVLSEGEVALPPDGSEGEVEVPADVGSSPDQDINQIPVINVAETVENVSDKPEGEEPSAKTSNQTESEDEKCKDSEVDPDRDEAHSSCGRSATSRSDSSKSDNLEEDEDGDLINDDDDEDLQTLRESMMSLLANDDPVDDDEDEAIFKVPKDKPKKSKAKTKKTKTKSKSKVKNDEDSEKPHRKLSGSSTGEMELQSIKETMRNILRQDKQKPEKIEETPKANLGAGDGPDGNVAIKTNAPGPLLAGTEAWDSDSGADDDEFFEEEDDVFSRLEATRVSLEVELGCDTFLKAYKTVQAIHEDEDEGMEEGMVMVSQILGDTKQHLYPSILQLVMADGAFTEDND